MMEKHINRSFIIESRNIFEDQLEKLKDTTRKAGLNIEIDFSLLVDGLTAEQNKGSRLMAHLYFQKTVKLS